MPVTLNSNDVDFDSAFQELLSAKREISQEVNEAVRSIIDAVRTGGDQALIALSEKFDRLVLTPQSLAISSAEVDTAIEDCSADELAALRFAAKRIKAFHLRQKPGNLDYRDDVGLRLGDRWTAVQAAGLYVPGGTASYPSSVLMNALPAKVAGVERLVMVTPNPDGTLNPLVLAAAREAGVDEIYRVGGAQAIAALAYGTETIVPVDVIVGPGNAYVAAAKRQVFGSVGIDMIAGPSELLIIADDHSDPLIVAADLLAQAEHDVAAQSILITNSARLAQEVKRQIQVHLQSLSRRKIAEKSWQDYGAVILASDLDEAAKLSNRLAPEHLELAVEDPDSLLPAIRNAGAIFMGHNSAEVLGDYVAGPNHVLPTARSARFSSGLSVLNFMKRSSYMVCSQDGLSAIGPSAVTLANAEGLTAHALSVSLRLKALKK